MTDSDNGYDPMDGDEHKSGSESTDASESSEGEEEEDPRVRRRWASSSAANDQHDQLSSIPVSKRAELPPSKRYYPAEEYNLAPANKRGKKRVKMENRLCSLGEGKPLKGDVPINTDYIKEGCIIEGEHGYWKVRMMPRDKEGKPSFRPLPVVPDKNKKDKFRPDETRIRFDQHFMDCIKVQDIKGTPYSKEVYEAEPKYAQHWGLDSKGFAYRASESVGKHAMANFVKAEHKEYKTWLDYVGAMKWKEFHNRFPTKHNPIGIWASYHQRSKVKSKGEGASDAAAAAGGAKGSRRPTSAPSQLVAIKESSAKYLQKVATEWLTARAPDSLSKLELLAAELATKWRTSVDRVFSGTSSLTPKDALVKFYLTQVPQGRNMFNAFIEKYKTDHDLGQAANEDEEDDDLRMKSDSEKEEGSGEEEEEEEEEAKSEKKKSKKKDKKSKKKKSKKSKRKNEESESEQEEEEEAEPEQEEEEEEKPKRKKHKRKKREEEEEEEAEEEEEEKPKRKKHKKKKKQEASPAESEEEEE